MKITQSQLRQIIKEELSRALQEGSSMPEVDKFINNVATTYVPELSKARDVLVNKVGEVLVDEKLEREQLKYMWDKMRNERMRPPEYAALYWWLSSLFGTDTITANFDS